MSMVQCNPSELRSLAGLLMNCATNLRGCADQAQGSFSVADSWHDGNRPRFEEAVAGNAASIRNHAQMLEEMCPQIEAIAQRYEELQRGG